MDNGPFRVPRPASRPAAPKQEPVPQPVVAEPKNSVVKEESKPVRHQNTTNRFEAEDKKRKKLLIPVVGVLAAVVIAAAGWFGWSALQGGGPAIDSGKYQAVFFTNGQVYFGKLSSVNSDYLKLTDVFYLQAQAGGDDDSENPQQASSGQGSNATLIKLGDEIHGPEDAMIISKDQVLFYENLKDTGKVSTTIEQYNKSKK